VRTILTSPEAEGREAQARVFALDSDMSPEVAAMALAASPTGKAVPALSERGNPAPLAGTTPPNTKVDLSASWDRSLKRAGAKLPA
jgi:hypothetical protein